MSAGTTISTVDDAVLVLDHPCSRKQLVIADTVSWAPLSEPTSADSMLQEETAALVNLILNHIPVTEERLEEITSFQARN